MSKVTKLRCECRCSWEEGWRELCPVHWAEHLENERWREQYRRPTESEADAKLNERHESGGRQ